MRMRRVVCVYSRPAFICVLDAGLPPWLQEYTIDWVMAWAEGIFRKGGLVIIR
jgi:hypothetical protein